jgi:hypothetical protein
MLSNMWRAEEEGDNKLACQLAKECAPYVHSKLASIDNIRAAEPVQISIQRFGDGGGDSLNLTVQQQQPALLPPDDDEEDDEEVAS